MIPVARVNPNPPAEAVAGRRENPKPVAEPKAVDGRPRTETILSVTPPRTRRDVEVAKADVLPPVNRTAQKPQPYHQRVRAEDIERLGISGDV